MLGPFLLFAFLIALAPWTTIARLTEQRAFFVFGDSLVDSGNNNYLETPARCDYPPYGIDFPDQRPTGRASNGERIGAEEPPLPYLSPELDATKLLLGANFASAGAAILQESSNYFVNVSNQDQQLRQYKEYQKRLKALIGQPKAEQLIKRAIILSSFGGNDFINNYYFPGSKSSRQYTMPEFIRLVIKEYRKFLKELHELGARNIVVTGVGPAGCSPGLKARRSKHGECDAELNGTMELYSLQLEQMLSELNGEIGANVFIAFNTRKEAHFDPHLYGFKTAEIACCGEGLYNGDILCRPGSNVCPERDLYFFWDSYHPTERASRIIVDHMMYGSTDHMNPVSLSTILAMD